MTEKRCINCMRKLTNDGGACPHCGFDPGQYKPPEQVLPPGATLNHGKYVIGRVLGRGGFGVTYVALDTTLDLRVAVKECLPRNSAWRNDSGASVQWGLSVPEQEIMLEGFVKEARKMAKIDQIPGVVRVREYFYENETAYIVMDYVEGETLAQYLRRNGPLSAEACFRVLAPAMDSLAQAHKRGLIHRDISPNNIMIETGGEKVWVLDLGAAKDLGSRLAAPNVSVNTKIVGTPGYTPLEQYSPDGKIGPWTDVYAMSSTFFRCMTGQKLPPSTSRALKDDAPELLEQIRGPVGAVLMKGVAQNTEKRYQSMTELREELEKAVISKPRPKPFPKKTLVIFLSLAVAALILTGIMLKHPKSVTPENKGGTLEDTPLSGMADTSESGAAVTEIADTSESGTAVTEIADISEAEAFAEIIASGECGDDVLWTLDKKGLLKISGTGNMTDYLLPFSPRDYFAGFVLTPWQNLAEMSNLPWAKYNLSEVQISDGITSIGDCAFIQVSLRRITIPDSVTKIGAFAFSESSLESVVIPDSVTIIAEGAFSKCNYLENVTIPGSVIKVGPHAFFRCQHLASVVISENVREIGDNAFYGCVRLQSVSIPDSVTDIGDYAFSECANLKSVSIPAGAMEYYSFDDETAVTRR